MKQKAISNIEQNTLIIYLGMKKRFNLLYFYIQRVNPMVFSFFEKVNLCMFLFYRTKLGSSKKDK